MKTISAAPFVASIYVAIAATMLAACDSRPTETSPDGSTVDAATSGGNAVEVSASADVMSLEKRDASDAAAADAQPTSDVDPAVAFAELAGTYSGKAKNVAGSSLTAFDEGAIYTFVIEASGVVTITSKTGMDVYDWAHHGKSIVRNSASQVNAINMEETDKRLLSIAYRPGSVPFDVGGGVVEPFGRWYLTMITKL